MSDKPPIDMPAFLKAELEKKLGRRRAQREEKFPPFIDATGLEKLKTFVVEKMFGLVKERRSGGRQDEPDNARIERIIELATKIVTSGKAQSEAFKDGLDAEVRDFAVAYGVPEMSYEGTHRADFEARAAALVEEVKQMALQYAKAENGKHPSGGGAGRA